jgi:hypothetical protein
VFSHKLTEDTELRLLEERHAEELTDLTDRNRQHLRAWLPWVDASRTLKDRKNFIRDSLKQLHRTRASWPASGMKVAWQGSLATTPRLGEPHR